MKTERKRKQAEKEVGGKESKQIETQTKGQSNEG